MPREGRLSPLFKAFADLSVTAEPVLYTDEMADEVRDRLLLFDGVLVWVDPITEGRDRSKLDPMLKISQRRAFGSVLTLTSF
jgi:hypothetical protein